METHASHWTSSTLVKITELSSGTMTMLVSCAGSQGLVLAFNSNGWGDRERSFQVNHGEFVPETVAVVERASEGDLMCAASSE